MDDLRAAPLEVGKMADPVSHQEKDCFITSILGLFGPGTELRILIREADSDGRSRSATATWVQIQFEAMPEGHPFIPPRREKPPTVFVGNWPLGCLYWTVFQRAPILHGTIDQFWDRPAISLVREGRDLLMKQFIREK